MNLTDTIMVASVRFLAKHDINIEIKETDVGWKSLIVATNKWFKMTPVFDENGESDCRNIIWYDDRCEFQHGYYHSAKLRRTIYYANPHYFDELLDAARNCWLESIGLSDHPTREKLVGVYPNVIEK